MSDDKVVQLGAKREKENKEASKHAPHNDDIETSEDGYVYCSFCHRPNNQVLKMVQGPGVNICSECAMIAVQYLILNDRMPSAEAQQILDAFWGKAKK